MRYSQLLLSSIVVILLCALVGDGGVAVASPVGWHAGMFEARAIGPSELAIANHRLGSAWAAQVDTGTYHSCALTVDGGVKCWGSNNDGQLGNGTTQGRLTPVDVLGLTTGVKAIAVGSYHTCALTVDGGVKCWGRNDYGQLGDGTTQGRLTPVNVVGLGNGVRTITAGLYHTCALTESGGGKCWGRNNSGELGDGTTTQRLTPVDVIGPPGNMSTITAGYFHTCALTESDGAKCWGYNHRGQLGDGTTMTRLTPVDVIGLAEGVRSIDAGSLHTCAVTGGGGARCWGCGAFGQLGNGQLSYGAQPTPVDVIGLQSGVATVNAGSHHSCAILAGGEVRCWGKNEQGQLGDGTTAWRLMPVDVVGLDSGVTTVSAGFWHTCAVLAADGVKCWGYNYSGQLGDGTTARRLTPVDVLVLVFDCGRVTEISQDECRALVALFESTQGMVWQNRAGWLATPTPCSWYGVTCTVDSVARGASSASLGPPWTAEHGVSELTLAGNGLNGQLPTALGDLTELRALDLSSNALSGGLPGELGDLAALRTLNLSHNELSGPIPPKLGRLSVLRELRLHHNRFNRIPPELGGLHALDFLDLSENILDGAIPAELGNLTALQMLDLSDNMLDGPLPAEWGRLRHLQSMDMHYNQIKGLMPAEWGDLIALQQLDMHQTSLSGPLPPEWGDMGALQTLILWQNDLSGPLPPEWGNMAALQTLDLRWNDLTGPLPPEWGNMTALQTLDLRWNELTGPIPPTWGDLRPLRWLNLSNNQLSGPIPPELGNLAAVEELDLSFNQLGGPIPPEFGRLSAVKNLYLNNNHLTGPIPPELGDLAALRSPAAQGARQPEAELAGPGSMSRPQSLAQPGPPPETGYLDLSCNQLSGPVPLALGQLTELEGLMLTANRLSGVLPWKSRYWGIYYTDMSHNMLAWESGMPIGYDDYSQTVPPTDLAATIQGNDVLLSWTPILYTEDDGHYEISYAANPAGPYLVHGRTPDKTVSSYTVTGLKPNRAYYFRVRTFTPAHYVGFGGPEVHVHHYYQQNDLWSEYSAVVSTEDVTPTPTPTDTPSSTPTPTVTPAITPAPTATPGVMPTSTPTATPNRTYLPLLQILP